MNNIESIAEHLISNLYRSLLNREPDEVGLKHKVRRAVAAEMSLEDIRREILSSIEYESIHKKPVVPTPEANNVMRGCFLANGARFTTHAYLSDKITDEQAEQICQFLRMEGCDTLDFSICLDGDYENVGLNIPVFITRANLDMARRRLDRAQDHYGLKLTAWMQSDDRMSFVDRNSFTAQTNYWTFVIDNLLKGRAEVVVLGLEALEYWWRTDSGFLAKELGQWLKDKVATWAKVAFHTLADDERLLTEEWIDIIYAQTKFESGIKRITNLVIDWTEKYQKPIVMAEYSMGGELPEAKQKGDAAIAAGAIGALNGSGYSENDTLPNQPPQLPTLTAWDGIWHTFTELADDSWRNNIKIISPSATDVMKWKQTIDLRAVTIGNKIKFDFSKPDYWARRDIGSGDSIGNFWIFQKKDGKVIGSTLDYFRPDQNSKDYPNVFHHAGITPPFEFKKGEQYAVMVSTLARNTYRTTNERSNMILFTFK